MLLKKMSSLSLVAALAVALLTAVGVSPARAAATDGTPDTAFNANVGTMLTKDVYDVAVQGDGKVLAGGRFSQGVARFDADGTPDADFNSNTTNVFTGFEGIGPYVMAVLVQGDGKIVVGGDRLTASQRYLIRLNADGTRDLSFTESVTGEVKSLAQDASGNILVAGLLTSPSQRLARLDKDGNSDSAFNGQFATDVFAANVWDATVKPNGKIAVAGAFTTPANGIAQFNSDGTPDTDFNNTTAGVPDTIYEKYVVATPDNDVIVGGHFTSPGQRIARFTDAGATDTGFIANVGSTLSSRVRALAVQADGKVLAGGGFTGRLVRFAADGTPDTTFNSNVVAASLSGSVLAIATQADGQIVIGGGFTSEVMFPWDPPRPVTSDRLARLNSAAVPGAPVLDSVTAGDSSADLAWTAPTSDGGADITDYEYRLGGSGGWTSLSTTGTSATISGLTNGTTYGVEVRAVNSVGNGAASNSVDVTPTAPAPDPAPAPAPAPAPDPAPAPAPEAPAAPAPEASTPSQPEVVAPVALPNAQKVLTKLKRQLKQGRDGTKLLRLKLKLGDDANARPTEIRWRFKMTGSQNKQRAKNGWARWRSVAVAPNAQRVRLDFADAGKVRKALTGKFADNSPVKLQVRGVNAAGEGPTSSVRLKPATRAATLPANG